MNVDCDLLLRVRATEVSSSFLPSFSSSSSCLFDKQSAFSANVWALAGRGLSLTADAGWWWWGGSCRGSPRGTINGRWFFQLAKTHRQRWMFTGANRDLMVTGGDSLLLREASEGRARLLRGRLKNLLALFCSRLSGKDVERVASFWRRRRRPRGYFWHPGTSHDNSIEKECRRTHIKWKCNSREFTSCNQEMLPKQTLTCNFPSFQLW